MPSKQKREERTLAKTTSEKRGERQKICVLKKGNRVLLRPADLTQKEGRKEIKTS